MEDQHPDPLLEGESLPSPPQRNQLDIEDISTQELNKSQMQLSKPEHPTKLRQAASHGMLVEHVANGNELDKLSKENFNLKLRIFYLEERLAKLRKGGDTNESLQQENFELKLLHEEKQQENNELNNVLVKAQAAVESLQTDLALCRAELDDVRGRSMSVESYRDEIDDKDDQIKQFGAMIRGLESRVQEMGENEASLKSQLESIESERDEAIRLSNELRESLEAVTNEMRTHAEQVEYLKDTIVSLESDLKDTDHVKARLRKQDDDLLTLRQENRDLNKQLADVTVQVGVQRAKFEQLQQQTEEVARLDKKEIDRLRKQLEESRDENEQVLRSRAKLEHELESTAKLLQTADETVEALENKVSSTVREADEMSQMHRQYSDEMQKEHKNMTDQLYRRFDAERESFQAELESKSLEMERLKVDLEHEKESRQNLQEMLRDQTHELAKMQGEVAKLQLIASQAESERDKEAKQRSDLSQSRAILERSHLDRVVEVGNEMLDWEQNLIRALELIVEGRGHSFQVPSLDELRQKLLSSPDLVFSRKKYDSNRVEAVLQKLKNHVDQLGSYKLDSSKVLMTAQGNWESKYNELNDRFQENHDKLIAANARIGTLSKLLEAERDAVVKANSKYQHAIKGQQGLLLQEINDDRASLRAKQDQIETLQEELEVLSDTVNSKQEELKLHKKHIAELEKLLHEHLLVSGNSEKKNTALKAQLEKKSIDLEAQRATNMETQRELSRLSNAYEKIQQEVQRLSIGSTTRVQMQLPNTHSIQGRKVELVAHERIWHDLSIRQDQLAELLHLLASLVDKTRSASQPQRHHPGWSKQLEKVLSENHKLAVKVNVLGADLQTVYQRFKVIESIALASDGGRQGARRNQTSDPVRTMDPSARRLDFDYSFRDNSFAASQASSYSPRRAQQNRTSPVGQQQRDTRNALAKTETAKLTAQDLTDTVVRSPTQPPLRDDWNHTVPMDMIRQNMSHGQVTTTSQQELKAHINRISQMLEKSCDEMRSQVKF